MFRGNNTASTLRVGGMGGAHHLVRHVRPRRATAVCHRLTLTERRQVIASLSVASTRSSGSNSGATCPGTNVMGACNDDAVGLTSQIDATLAAGTYWVMASGCGNGAAGDYTLDVVTLAPLLRARGPPRARGGVAARFPSHRTGLLHYPPRPMAYPSSLTCTQCQAQSHRPATFPCAARARRARGPRRPGARAREPQPQRTLLGVSMNTPAAPGQAPSARGADSGSARARVALRARARRDPRWPRAASPTRTPRWWAPSPWRWARALRLRPRRSLAAARCRAWPLPARRRARAGRTALGRPCKASPPRVTGRAAERDTAARAVVGRAVTAAR